MKVLPSVVGAAVLALSLGCTSNNPSPVAPSTSVEDTPVASRLALKDELRRLLTERTFWTRSLIITTFQKLPDRDATVDRLMRNQADLGNAFKAYYGDAMASQLTRLLEEQVQQTTDLIASVPVASAAQVQPSIDQWRTQANTIADFLAASNPSFHADELRAQFQAQLDSTLAQMNARLAADWTDDVAAFDTAQHQAITLADLFTEGTAAQYPKKVLEPVESQREQDLHSAQRRLWHEHVEWERLTMLSNVSQLPDLAAAQARLLRNQKDLGDLYRPIYGDAVGDELTRLLTVHVESTSELSVANTDQLAQFFATTITPLDVTQLQADLRNHLQQTALEESYRLAANHPSEIATYDAAETFLLGFSDTLTSGTATQSGAQSIPPF